MKKKLLVILIISAMCSISLFSLSTKQTNAVSGNYNIAFGEMYYVESSSELLDYIRWSFECSNSVNIVVYLMTDDDFSSWADTNFILLSSGQTSDSGKYTIPSEDTWVIVFMHSDLTHPFRTAEVYIDVHFSILDLIDDSINWDRVLEIVFLILKIAVPIIVGLISLRIIVAIVRSFKQKKSATELKTTKSEITKVVEKPKELEVQDDSIVENQIYCTKCGMLIENIKNFCINCGEAL